MKMSVYGEGVKHFVISFGEGVKHLSGCNFLYKFFVRIFLFCSSLICHGIFV